MIQFNGFVFASPPRTASTWFVKACYECGLGAKQQSKVHEPPPADWNGYYVSLVRHPYDWLVSYHLALEGGYTGIDCVDVFSSLSKESGDVYEFLARYLDEMPGTVGEMFSNYKASTIMRVEDLPWAVIELLESLGVKSKITSKLLEFPAVNCRRGHAHVLDKELRKKIVKAEDAFCEQYDYF